ncbi:PDK repeat-containing protein [Thermoplasmatales archaeon SCGC AB-540-F20]|nr:PDK repeat-containing protein [Thermoplasmatales archaeon SCGC AB-540-F20]
MDDDDAVTTSNPHNISIIQLESSLQLPIPKINGPYNGYTNENISFSSNGSYDSDGIIINYTWDFGYGNNSYLEDPVHSYAEPKNYTVILTVTDNDNLSNAIITKAIIIDKEIEEPEEKELPLMFLSILLIIIIATILVLILLPRKSDKNKYKTAEVETLLSELMKIMHSKDVDAKFVTDKLDISSNELGSLVDELVKRGLLRYTTDDEVELTEQGIKYIESK